MDELTLRRFQDWMAKHATSTKCPTCGHSGYDVLDIVGANVLKGDRIRVDSDRREAMISLLPLLCLSCGHVRFFSTQVIGVQF